MTLEDGIYIIQNQREGKPSVGRDEREDKSLLPKKVITLPEGVLAPRWEVKKVDENKYRLSVRGAPTGILDDFVFAFLTDAPSEKAENWHIQEQPQHGVNIYTAEHRDVGWVVPMSGEAYQQVAVEPLKHEPGRIIPPRYYPNEIFEFIRIDRED
ncbi:hypothetical protein K474DRAFT_1712957 [Panus rudis PR-1116 ss-1]|nr:hypothetical protein K474DRAFT_1712957 [Panus rudis PR-1116 ss-1]